MALFNYYTATNCLLFSAVDCGSPTNIFNGSPGIDTPGTTLGGLVTYTCNSGYEVSTGVTTAMATCMASGMWEPVPTCSRKSWIVTVSLFLVYFTAVDCGDLTAFSNGAVDTSSGTTFLMTATYTCNTGYTHIGTVTRTCQANAMWSLTAPTCTCTSRV